MQASKQATLVVMYIALSKAGWQFSIRVTIMSRAYRHLVRVQFVHQPNLVNALYAAKSSKHYELGERGGQRSASVNIDNTTTTENGEIIRWCQRNMSKQIL